MPKYKVHPAADIFPMLSDDQLQDMADDIKNRGLQNPISLGKWMEDGEEVIGIIAGRNRQRACEIAEVDPTYKTETGDVIEFINGENLLRVHMTAGQRAMAKAILYSEPGKRGGSKLRGTTLKSDVDKGMLSRARKVLKHSPEYLAKEVMSGSIPLDKAVEITDREIAANKKNNEMRKWLEDNSPEIYGQYEDNRISLEEAKEKAEQEIKRAKEEAERAKELAEAQRQGLIAQYNQAFEGLKENLEAAGKMSQGLYRLIPGWLDDNQTTHNPDDVYNAFTNHFPKGYAGFQALVNTLEAATRGISEIHQALVAYERSRRPPPVVVSTKPRSVT